VRHLAILLMPLTLSPCLGQTTGEVSPPTAVGLTGTTVTVGIDIDPGPGAEVGGYGATLTWDPDVLQFVVAAGGDAPFDDPVVNASNAESGLLSFADADAIGAADRVNVLIVTFQSNVDPPAATSLDLAFTSLFEAGTFEDLLPQAETEDGTACVSDFFYDLRLSGSTATILEWTPVPGAASYDVIRGELAGLLADPAAVHLGVVACLENDSLDTTTGAGTEPENPDTDVPLSGEGFFYLLRHHDGAQDSSYGFFVDCFRERVADTGDCP